MNGFRSSRAAWLAVLHMAVLGGPSEGADAGTTGSDPAAEVQAQYEAAVQALRRPSASGVLVTEVLPDSPAGAAGVRAGDIITSYYGEPITSLAVLREQVAEAVARRIEEGATSRAVLRARRALPGGKIDDITVQLPREPLGIRAVEVQVGLEGPRNPPPSLRGTINLNWAGVIEALRAEEGVIALRTQERPGAATTRPSESGEVWLGWQRYRVTAEAADRLSATLELARIDPSQETVQVMEGATFTFRLRLGDYYNTPAFVLESTSAEYAGMNATVLKAQAARLGETFRSEVAPAKPAGESGGGSGGAGDGARTVRRTHPAPLTAIVQPAVPLVAAGMPHAGNAVLALHLVSVRDFVPRPGYVLATRGRQPLPAGAGQRADGDGAPAETAWRVDLLHFGVVVESYWFSEGCRLLCVQSDVGTPVVHRRVLNPADAAMPFERKAPATRPAAQ